MLAGGNAAGKKFARANADGDNVRYDALNLADVSSVTWRVATKIGGTIELRRDSAEGEVLAFVTVKPTGAWNIWEEVISPMKPVDQRCDVVAVFKNPGQTNFLSLDWLQFNSGSGR